MNLMYFTFKTQYIHSMVREMDFDFTFENNKFPTNCLIVPIYFYKNFRNSMKYEIFRIFE